MSLPKFILTITLLTLLGIVVGYFVFVGFQV